MAAVAAHRKAGLPAITALVVAGGLALVLLPAVADLLVYDRARVLAGEAWRLVTGHAVHFSWSHAAWNLVLFAVAGGWLERSHRAQLGWLIGLTTVTSGLYFLAFMPDMARYGGLSGVASAAVICLSLHEMRRDGPVRAVWVAVLLLFAAKIGYEVLAGRAVFATPGATPFAVVPAVHIIGAAVAAGLITVSRKPRVASGPSDSRAAGRRRRSATPPPETRRNRRCMGLFRRFGRLRPPTAASGASRQTGQSAS